MATVSQYLNPQFNQDYGNQLSYDYSSLSPDLIVSQYPQSTMNVVPNPFYTQPLKGVSTLQPTSNIRVGSVPSTGLAKYGNELKNAWNGMSTGQKFNTVANSVTGLMNAYNAFKANKLANQQFKFQKDTWAKEWENQRKMTNSRLEDRQRARVANNANQSMSVSDYMSKYGV